MRIGFLEYQIDNKSLEKEFGHELTHLHFLPLKLSWIFHPLLPSPALGNICPAR